MNKDKRKKIIQICIALISVNLGLFVLKFVPSYLFASVSLRADAFNSLGDLAYSVMFLIGLVYALKPKDKSHPHGHERLEPFLSLLVSIAIASTGVMVVRQALLSLLYNPTFNFNPFFIVALIVSIVLKFWLSKYLDREGENLDSSALTSSAKDAKADVFASFTALAGIMGAYCGLLWLDALFGLIVSIWIFRTAYEIGKKNFEYLTGASPPKKEIEKIERILNDHDKVISCRDLEAHYVGPKIDMSVKVYLPNDLDFEDAHRIEEDLETEIKELGKIDSVYLHLEPAGSEGSCE